MGFHLSRRVGVLENIGTRPSVLQNISIYLWNNGKKKTFNNCCPYKFTVAFEETSSAAITSEIKTTITDIVQITETIFSNIHYNK